MNWIKVWDNTQAFFRLVPLYWGVFSGDVIFVSRLSDLPEPINGEIVLLSEKTYYFTRKLDLEGSVVKCGENSVILGFSSENSAITSTGKPDGIPLISSEYTTPVRHITFNDVDLAIDFNGGTNIMALDWTGVNFLNVPNIGTIQNSSNFIFTKGAFLNSKGLVLDGEIGTVGLSSSIFIGDGLLGDIITIPSTATITRRFRIIYSAVVAFGSTNAINVDVDADIPVDSYILDTVDFSGGSTFIVGVQNDDKKANFLNCKGITNSRTLAWCYFIDNGLRL